MPKAIDTHIHPPPPPGTRRTPLREATDRYFRAPPPPRDADEMADSYIAQDIFGILLASNWESTTGEPPVPNDYVAAIVHKYPRQFAGFCSVDPWDHKKAIAEIERCVRDLGFIGVKFHPTAQAFYPNDPRFYPMWEKCADLGVPVLLHTGMTGLGAGAPGGGGLKTKYCAPIPHIDDLAADFQELTIIMAHPGFPWVEEQMAVLLHKPNVFMDLSGYSPRYFPQPVFTYGNTLLQDRMMFGSDYPSIRPERWLADFAEAPFREEVRAKILLENARRILKLTV